MNNNRSADLWRAAWQIARKDLRIEWRRRALISAMLLFTLIAVMVFYFALGDQPALRQGVAPAVLWVTVAFAALLGLGRSLAQEADQGSLEGLLLAPIPRAALFYGKLIPTTLFTFAVAAVGTIALTILFNQNFPATWWLIALLGCIGLSAAGILVGSIAIAASGRETTFPILLLPIVLPMITAAVDACALIVQDRPFADWSAYLLTLVTIDVIFLILPLLLFSYILEE